MSDTAATILAAAAVQIVLAGIGFLTFWVKLKYGFQEAKEEAASARQVAARAVAKAQIVEDKLDVNTATTNAVDSKADTIVSQTNGTMERLRMLVEAIAERVDKLEDYNRTASHRVLDVLNAINLKITAIEARQTKTPKESPNAGGNP